MAEKEKIMPDAAHRVIFHTCRFLLISSGPIQTSIDRDIDQDDKTKSKSESNKTKRGKVNF